ncbi:carbohydrate ABC transporter permease [Cohnella soli]|uniref:Carbohydrate ABC transporter permease n=1 Tax=Cohnella soli TaxID=425005 RepID=A0ABW0HYS0_9BACL
MGLRLRLSGRDFVQLLLYALLAVTLFLTLAPIFYMLFSSLKSNSQIIGNFWSLPSPAEWGNYGEAFRGIARYMLNTILYALAGSGLVILLSSLSGYAFAKRKFPGKEFLFLLMLTLMMIPGILTLIPSYVLYSRLGLTDTPWVIIIAHAAAGQIMGTFLCRTFIAGIPSELFESARMDGASETVVYFRMVMPLSAPIISTVFIMQSVAIYNDYIWPLLTISDNRLQMLGVGLTLFTNQFGISDMGLQSAAYAISSVPLILVFMFGMKYFIQGVTSGALKM